MAVIRVALRKIKRHCGCSHQAETIDPVAGHSERRTVNPGAIMSRKMQAAVVEAFGKPLSLGRLRG